MTDNKASSTEDLCIRDRNSLDALRLEAVIKVLVENKVETLKNSKRQSYSISSSPKSLFKKLMGNSSTSTVSSPEILPQSAHIISQHNHDEGLGKESRTSPPICSLRKTNRSLQFSENNTAYCPSIQDCSANICHCRKDNEIQIHMEDDFISLNIEDCDHPDTDEEALKRAQKKRRRRRMKRRRRRELRHHQRLESEAGVEEVQMVDGFKDLDDDELSQRARLTIALTAFLLLFMCLLLVGITLRMAPLIDEMVRKENEELLNSLSQESQDFSNRDNFQNLTSSVPLV